MLKKRLKRTAILCAFALVIGAGIGYMQIQSEGTQFSRVMPQAGKDIPMPGSVDIGGPFTLTHHNGHTVTEKDFSGGYKLIYFGFTYCPAICPTELQKIRKVLKALKHEDEKFYGVFITVDPERDTQAVMKEYVSLFRPITGLTGTRAQIDDVMKKYRVFANKVEDPQLSDYTMDHSSFIYLMSPEDKMLGMYRIEDTYEYIAEDVKGKLDNS